MYKKELIHTPARGAKMEKLKTATWSHPPETISSAECHANPSAARLTADAGPVGSDVSEKRSGTGLAAVGIHGSGRGVPHGMLGPSDDERRHQRLNVLSASARIEGTDWPVNSKVPHPNR
jgi:hypothetical protein